jgi:hypothetical protein
MDHPVNAHLMPHGEGQDVDIRHNAANFLNVESIRSTQRRSQPPRDARLILITVKAAIKHHQIGN